MRVSVIFTIAAPALVAAQQTLWGQCGGIGYTGPSGCVAGAACTTQNAYYAQCVPGTAQTTARTTTPGVVTTTRTTTGSQPAGTGLSALIKSKGKKYVGFAADPGTLSDNGIAAILRAESGQLTAENSMKWDALEPSRNSFSWGNADTLANFATSNGMLIRGHTLLWHAQLPQWVKNIGDRNTLTQVIQNHIANVAGRYRGKIYAWDVANEVIADGGGMRSSVFSQVFGNWEFLDVAFRAARAADPAAKLCLNDYNIDYASGKLTTFLQVVRDLKSRGVPIDCVGTQSHLGVGSGNIANYRNVLNQLAGLGGVEVQITELDIATPSTSITSAQLTQQRNDYRTVVSACMSISACSGITLWGVTDARTWITGRHPLLWDENYQKKPAYFGFVDGINS